MYACGLHGQPLHACLSLSFHDSSPSHSHPSSLAFFCHRWFNFCALAACEASWFRPGGLNCDWWAAVNIHTNIDS